MPETEFTQIFWDDFKKLPKEIQKKVLKAIRLLAENPQHPSLRAKPIQGAKGIYEATPDMHYRMTYERLPGDRLLLRRVGVHDDAIKNP